MKSRHKVFCIGLHKTGTTSLGAALETLGYEVCGGFGARDPEIRRLAARRASHLVQHYDAFRDHPWPLLYPQLDEWVPNAKFVLTIRPPREWIRSVILHFGNRQSPMRKWIYGEGSPMGNEHLYIDRYETHNREVVEFFRDRADDLLVMSTDVGYSWAQLCPFLGLPILDQPFPRLNQAMSRKFAPRP